MVIVASMLFGLVIGSFLNLLIDRIPRNEQIITGRSRCDSCKKALSARDLIPVVSWVLLRGKCRYCVHPIPGRNLLVEMSTAVLFASVVVLNNLSHPVVSPAPVVLGIDLAIVAILIIIFFIDLEHMIIPDSLVVSLLSVSLLLHAIFPLLSSLNYILSGVLSAGFFLFLVLITRGRGMGMGDVKYAGAAGVLLGFPGTVYALYLAFLTGAFFSVILILNRKKRLGQTIPFGPFLVVGTLLAHLNLLDPIGSAVLPF